MSSFTIDKKEYVKAAGIIAGIAEASSSGMVVLSTPNKIHGASAILDTATLDKIAANNGGSFYVIPSSIHECLLLADIAPLDELREMVKAVNDTTVAPEERLSDSVYIYKDGALQIAA